MNLQDGTVETNKQPNELAYFNFNQDFTSLVIGRKGNYSIHSLAVVNKSLPLLYTFPSNDEVILVERLFSTSLIVFVTAGQPSRLVLHHFKKQKEVCTYNYPTNILAVKLNKSCLVVCLEDSISIHSIRDLKTLHVIRDVPLNTHITCTLSPNSPTNCFIAYPASNHTGEVAVFDAENLRAIWSIEAHDNVVVAMAFSHDGLLLATASVKGTVIRVFSVLTKSKVYEFRRGMKRCATVYSLAFSKDCTFLCCASSTETVHVFKIDTLKLRSSNQESQPDQGWMDYLGQAIKSSTTYLPTQVSEVLCQERGFAAARMPEPCPNRNVCGIVSIENSTYLMVVLQDGEMLVYSVDVINGGDCNIVAQHSLTVSGIPIHHHHHHQPSSALSSLSSSSSSSSALPTQESASSLPSPQPSSSSSSSMDNEATPTECQSPINDLDWTKVKKLPTANTSPQWSPCRRSYASVVVSNQNRDGGVGDGSDHGGGDKGGDGCESGRGCCDGDHCSPVKATSSSLSSSPSQQQQQPISSLPQSAITVVRSGHQHLQQQQQQQPKLQLQQPATKLHHHQQQQQQQQQQHHHYQQNQKLKLEGELALRDAVVSIEDLYLDAECGWLEDSAEFPSIFKKK